MMENPGQRLRILAIAHDFSRSPSGTALLRVLRPLATDHDITCLSCGPQPPAWDERMRYVHARAWSRGGLLMRFLAAHLALPQAVRRLLRQQPFDVIQTIDSESLAGTVVTFHCCHAAYRETMRQRGLFTVHGWTRRLAILQIRLLMALRVALERRICRSPRTRMIIALSSGSAEDIRHHYQPRAPVLVIPNVLP